MKAITTILLTLLVLGGCSTEEGAKRIYPDGGLFTKNKTYYLDCMLRKHEGGKSKYFITLDRNKYVYLEEDIGLFRERWSRTEVTDIEFYSDEVEFRTSYKLFFLNRSKGSIHAGDGYPEESGWCIEEGWRWYWNEETNTGTYERDRG